MGVLLNWKTIEIPKGNNGAYILLSAIVAGVAILFNYSDLVRTRQKEQSKRYLHQIKKLTKELNTTLKLAIENKFNSSGEVIYPIPSPLHTQLYSIFMEISTLFKDLKFENKKEKKSVQKEIKNYINDDYLAELDSYLNILSLKISHYKSNSFDSKVTKQYVEIICVLNELNLYIESSNVNGYNTKLLFSNIEKYEEKTNLEIKNFLQPMIEMIEEIEKEETLEENKFF
ncbi:MAG: hypothetical protein COA44_12760 [Arcobacter sp.]|nr:MAG: hypothetical protein COA44_12760 [Arcobacter sp.]